MARGLTCTALLLLLVLLLPQFICLEARKLKARKCIECSAASPLNIYADMLHHVTKQTDGDGLDAFRPTNPGRSPGVGH